MKTFLLFTFHFALFTGSGLAQTAGQYIFSHRAASGNGNTAVYITPQNNKVLGFDGSGNLVLSTVSSAWADITGKPATLSGYGITDAQALDADLTAIAALSGFGVPRRLNTSPVTWTIGSLPFSELAGNIANSQLINSLNIHSLASADDTYTITSSTAYPFFKIDLSGSNRTLTAGDVEGTNGGTSLVIDSAIGQIYLNAGTIFLGGLGQTAVFGQAAVQFQDKVLTVDADFTVSSLGSSAFVNVPSWGTLSGTTPALAFTATPQNRTFTLSGDTTFTASGYAQGYTIDIFITADSSTRTLTFPAWTWIEGAPANIAASKHMWIQLKCTGSTASSVFAVYGVEP